MCRFALRQNKCILDNASILYSGCLKDKIEALSIKNPSCRKAGHNHCSLLTAHYSLFLQIHCRSDFVDI
ncbi:MAG: hypothetical protein IKX14_03870 [Neisseriaceae bacterium]|nr:hypothetical protein [Neisseriaceae bacterium]